MAAYPATIIMTSHEHLLHVRIWCVVALVALSSAVKSLCSALVHPLMILHSAPKDSVPP